MAIPRAINLTLRLAIRRRDKRRVDKPIRPLETPIRPNPTAGNSLTQEDQAIRRGNLTKHLVGFPLVTPNLREIPLVE